MSDLILLKAYGLGSSGSLEIIQSLKKKPLSSLILKVEKSDRYPQTIMILAASVGMYIPFAHRIGYQTYEFFMKNVRYYEPTFSRNGRVYPSPEEIFLTKNRLDLLMKFRDDEILRDGIKWDFRYTDRKVMLLRYIADNVISRGEFTIESNSRSSYAAQARIIVYIQGEIRQAFNIEELARAVDVDRKVVWRSDKEFFDTLSLIGLRQQILEKFGQWKDRLGYVDIPGELVSLVQKLDEILPPERIPDISVYLSNPVL